ncbi:LacI family DNA-binding transcriptional regulator [Sulfitobacter pseudonitzschiae]|uniref:LacI family DNA-binding transcriptional regulator n=1 Tax=Pseudosulfitobacter pseudonitzschiae TaxID=1402135 RepID=A0A9Q2S0Q2_9RHOB|nr:LacI family DNA-binding transcriptional regulator [Pseudosulfitobacter pseudonitzschiae]MBM2293003.1 LacI family DNA-binding transcriptional regulator [Pseudosulfitobacter pseudonitzschiae]MBM2297709.1 LacI family DNA-binding transcriptional regulator [Pseudosulfitobacter pseudonitzschiae]MBM2302623.1 LacI family DNA-binding transcriptional regulator [Pseudosulfitobacter pseudonitzschiae]MBM2312387.1 LacI family DNA-binding transcriptional regulator [Pseudosulfitobacter pseudonitzschiae]MBM
MSGPTVRDVAEVAQVSLATVDRVLNNRGGVSAKVVDRVKAAVVQTGYVRNLAAANLSRRRIYRFCFVVPTGDTGFVALLHAALAQEQHRLREEQVVVQIVPTRPFDVEDQIAALRNLDCDAVAVMVSEAPEINEEIASLLASGVRVVSLVADLPSSGRDAYVGPDNVMAGRTAAEFMGRFIKDAGNILMIAGSLAARDHSERLLGFQMVMQERFDGCTLLPAAQGADDAARVEQIVLDTARDRPIAGIYAIGAGNRGLVRAVGTLVAKPVTIVHELTQISREALRTGTFDLVIDQDIRAGVIAAVGVMRDLTDSITPPADAGRIKLNIYSRENIQ